MSAEAPLAREERLRALAPWAVVLAIGFYVLLPKLGAFGLWDPWEPKYVESAREMRERGSYFLPFYRDELRLTKPILVYWGVLAGSAVFGHDELGARIAGALLGVGCLAVTYYAVARLHGRRAGLLAAVVLGTSPLYYLLARTATPDIYLVTTAGASLLFFCLGAFGPERERDRHHLAGYACFALAVLAKGPILAGLAYFGPLALYGLSRLDTARLTRPPLRAATLRLVGLGLPATGVALACLVGAYLVGTSPEWWGYSDASRNLGFAMRERVLDLFERAHLARLGLVALALTASWWSVHRARRPGGAGRWVRAAAWAGVAIAALAALVSGDLSHQVRLTLVLAPIVLGAVGFASVWGLVRHPALRDELGPWTRELARQALRFVVVFALVAGPWHAVVLFREGHGFFTDFILKHNVSRASEAINSSGSADFYFRSLFYGLLPWTGLLPVALSTAVRRWGRDPFRASPSESYLLLASTVILAVFSASATKFSYYIAPILVPLAVLIGVGLDRLLARADTATARLGFLAAAVLSFMMLANLAEPDQLKYVVGTFTVKREVPASVEIAGSFLPVLGGFSLVLALLAFVRSRLAVGALVLGATLVAHSFATDFIPRLSPHKTMKHLVELFEERRTAQEPLALHGGMKHGVVFYTHGTIDYVDDGEFVDYMRPDHPAYCIVARPSWRKLEPLYHAQFPGAYLEAVEAGHFDYVLVENHPPRAAR